MGLWNEKITISEKLPLTENLSQLSHLSSNIGIWDVLVIPSVRKNRLLCSPI